MTIVVRAELRVRPGRREEFVRAAAALGVTAGEEAGTLRDDRYGCADPHEFVVMEEYADADAAVAHNRHCAVLLRGIAELVDMTAVHLHGEVGPDREKCAMERSFAHVQRPLRLVAYGHMRRHGIAGRASVVNETLTPANRLPFIDHP
ncbi:MAG TPA: antibiotic biosynthesis monooxygenase family protein, partial [Pseudonocardia sp.]